MAPKHTKAKATAKARVTKPAKATTSRSVVVPEAADTASQQCTRKLKRQSTPDALERAVGNRLDGIPRSVILSRKNSSNRTILEEAEYMG